MVAYQSMRRQITGVIALLCVFTLSAQAMVIPSPREDGVACGYPPIYTGPRHVCNPDGVLTWEDMQLIDRTVEDQRYYFDVGVVVLEKMPQRFAKGKPNTERVQLLAEIVHDSWGVGDAEHGLGSVFLLAVGDRAMYLSNGKGVAERVSAEETQAIIDDMKPYLRSKSYGDAVVSGFLQLYNTFARVESEVSFLVDVSHPWTDGDYVLFWFLIMVMICACIVICASQAEELETSRRGRERQREQERFSEHLASRRSRSPAPCPAPSAPPAPSYNPFADATAPPPSGSVSAGEVHHHHHHTTRTTERNNYFGDGYGSSLWNWGPSWSRPAPAPSVVVVDRTPTARPATTVVVEKSCPRVCSTPAPPPKPCNPCEKARATAAVSTALKKNTTAPRARHIPETHYEGGTRKGGNGAAGTW